MKLALALALLVGMGAITTASAGSPLRSRVQFAAVHGATSASQMLRAEARASKAEICMSTDRAPFAAAADHEALAGYARNIDRVGERPAKDVVILVCVLVAGCGLGARSSTPAVA